MPTGEHSFDVVSRVDLAEVQNAVNQARKEIQTRFDFQGSAAELELDLKAPAITLLAEDRQRLRNMLEILRARLAKRGVSMRALQIDEVTAASGGLQKQTITLQQGIPVDKAKAMQTLLRNSKLKVSSQLQADQVRVYGDKKDDLQAAIALLRRHDFGLDLQFVNLR
jgi:uncharacterized protein YajQ (UPF0234 family)